MFSAAAINLINANILGKFTNGEVAVAGSRRVEAGGHELTGGLALHPPAVSAPAGTSILGWRCWLSVHVLVAASSARVFLYFFFLLINGLIAGFLPAKNSVKSPIVFLSFRSNSSIVDVLKESMPITSCKYLAAT